MSYAQLLDGKAVGADIIEQIRQDLSEKEDQALPGLAVVLVGENPASQVYVRNKQRACARAGLHSELIRLAADSTQADLLATIDQLNAREDIHGILVQLPLPAQSVLSPDVHPSAP
ncbi:MAG: tetrahydrofolate dehydrogenase/cyclohydrolase catalytic domain-containing protein, partial [Pseudomonadota bacterium]